MLVNPESIETELFMGLYLFILGNCLGEYKESYNFQVNFDVMMC